MQKIKILIVDDSAFMRKSLEILLSQDPDIEIVGFGKNGKEAVEKAKELKPDVITLDIEMPVMDGLTALQIIMKEAPTTVIMISSLTTEGAESTLKAMQLGAVDFIPKEMSFVSVNISGIKDSLIQKIKSVGNKKTILGRLARVRSDRKPTQHEISYGKESYGTAEKQLEKKRIEAIALGISTGGPISLQKVIPNIKGNLNVPLIIVQHMPPNFTKSLANRLNGMSKVSVKEAEHGEILKNGMVYIAPGGKHITFRKEGMSKYKVNLSDEPANTLHRPSVDVMMSAAANTWGNRTLGIIMTGMGKDGLEGAKLLNSKGGLVIAQDEESSVVWGMPRAIYEAGIADIVAPLEKIADLINKVIR